MEKPLKPASPERMAFLRERVKEAHPFALDRKPLTEDEAIEIYMNTSPFRLYLADDNPFKMALSPRLKPAEQWSPEQIEAMRAENAAPLQFNKMPALVDEAELTKLHHANVSAELRRVDMVYGEPRMIRVTDEAKD